MPILSIEDADVVIFASVERACANIAEQLQPLAIEELDITIVVADDFSLLVCEVVFLVEHVEEVFACVCDVLIKEVNCRLRVIGEIGDNTANLVVFLVLTITENVVVNISKRRIEQIGDNIMYAA